MICKKEKMFPKTIKIILSLLSGSLVTTAWHFLRLRMEGRPLDMEGSCEYIE
jgi:hypothetical protein